MTFKNKLMDIGLNLIDKQFQGIYHGKKIHPCDIKNVINKMIENDVSRCMLTSSSIQDYHDNSKICEDYKDMIPNIGYTVGIHPCSSAEMMNGKDIDFEKFSVLEGIWKDLLKTKNRFFMAFGEFGLDYDRLEYADKETQQKVFEKQLEIISKLTVDLDHKPPVFFLHMRSCNDDLLTTLDKYEFHKEQKFIVHSFTDSLKLMDEIIARKNYFISFNNCSLRTEEGLQNLKHCPLDKLFLETDAPWCGIRKTHPSYPLLVEALEEHKDNIQYKQLDYTVLKKKKIPLWFEQNGLDKDDYLIGDRHEPCELWKVYLLVSKLKNSSYEEIVNKVWDNCQNTFTPM
ncbi:hypothetical protein FOG50_01062 [Hanseniaspora uvarum]|nr:hypothetical protein FOG50_01062 [Hanseniaspora uvarum]